VEVDSVGNYDALIANSSLPVLVDFWAVWCPPCRQLAPELETVAREERGRWIVAKVNTEQLPELQGRYRIRGIPTMILFRDGTQIAQDSGARPAAAVREFMRTAVA
jgi:thioredoxin 2